MEGILKDQFISKLEEQYGPWNKHTSNFGNTTFGNIAKDLSISASQFTKLIYGTATEGMYVRSIENINRLIHRKSIRQELEEARKENTRLQDQIIQYKKNKQFSFKNLLFITFLSLISGAFLMYLYNSSLTKNLSSNSMYQHPLTAYFDQDFDADFDSPYLNESEVQAYCPCSAYEGKWSMNESFKLPLPGSRQPGLYYIAKNSDIRMRCSKINAQNVGKALAGYEYLISEIWIDTDQIPLIPKYFNNVSKSFTPDFEALVFEEQAKFKKVAILHAFNVNHFEIYTDSIVRRAELTGRFASDVDHELTHQYEIDIKHILENVLGNLTKTDCQSTPNLFCDPNELQEGESVISFNCMYTIRAENLGIGGGYPYTKSFRLEEQSYSDNLTCNCQVLKAD